MHRSELQHLAAARVREARVLLDSGQPAGAYYLAGYAIECALKSCVARRFQRYDIPDKALVNSTYTHKLTTLVQLARLEAALKKEVAADPQFGVNWAVVKDWSEEARYRFISTQSARDMLTAIRQRNHGVLPWIKKHW